MLVFKHSIERILHFYGYVDYEFCDALGITETITNIGPASICSSYHLGHIF